MTEPQKETGRRRLSRNEKIRRVLYFLIFYIVCFVIASPFDSEWVSAVFLCLVVGVGIGEINGISIFNFLSRRRDQNNHKMK
ncbi:hypothetical protein G6K97_00025 [Agrobacterium rhizogenes]|uniref:hypothetical protein n=1 Tax=Rhizobium rhizogenes TaxID=359 RepID=UPI00157306A4|nr:hypothetical protein [Rhizobium rhizogenes]NTH75506.1 hypothetical protein [Rhizobium rhizogenes]NTH81511.1 hypothetical protein [Rhizobium rhizogenes]